MWALHWFGGEGVEVVRARSFTDLRPFRMTGGVWGVACWYRCSRDWRCWLRVSSPTLSAENADKGGAPCALRWFGGEGVEVVRARSFTDLRPLRMTNGVWGVARWYRAASALWDRRCWLRVSSPTLSAKNAERVGHPACVYVVRARSFTDLRPLRMTDELASKFVGRPVGGHWTGYGNPKLPNDLG